MKANKLTTLFVSIILSSTLFGQSRDYEVTLWIHQIEDSTLYIFGSYGEKESLLIDSLQMTEEGSFVLKGNYNSGIVVVANKIQKFFSFILDKNTKFSIDMYPYGYYEVKGCDENKKYLEYQKRNKEYKQLIHEYETQLRESPEEKDNITAEIQKAKANFNKYQQNFFKEYPNNLMTAMTRSIQNPRPNPKFFANGKLIPGKELEYAYDYRTRFWDNFNFQDPRLLYTPYFYKKFKTYIDKITMQDADSVFVAMQDFINTAKQKGDTLYSPYIINLYLEKLPMMPFSFNESLYIQIVENLLNKGKTPWISPSEIDRHNENIEILKPFLPKNQFPNINNLNDIKAKYTIVHFHSSTCESCKKNINDLYDFYTNLSHKYNCKILSINVGEKTTEAPFPWTNWDISPQDLKQNYGIDIIRTPEIYILDENKKILNKTVIYSHIKKAIEEWENF